MLLIHSQTEDCDILGTSITVATLLPTKRESVLNRNPKVSFSFVADIGNFFERERQHIGPLLHIIQEFCQTTSNEWVYLYLDYICQYFLPSEGNHMKSVMLVRFGTRQNRLRSKAPKGQP